MSAHLGLECASDDFDGSGARRLEERKFGARSSVEVLELYQHVPVDIPWFEEAESGFEESDISPMNPTAVVVLIIEREGIATKVFDFDIFLVNK